MDWTILDEWLDKNAPNLNKNVLHTQVASISSEKELIKTTLIAEQAFTCGEWGDVEITAEEIGSLAKYDGMNVEVVFDGTTYTAPVVYSELGGYHLKIGEWDENENCFDFSNIPVAFDIYASGTAHAYTTDKIQHIAEVFIYEDPDVIPQPTGTINITRNGTFDVSEYASASVVVSASAVVSGRKNITANGIYDITEYASVNVNVPSRVCGQLTIQNDLSFTVNVFQINTDASVTPNNVSITSGTSGVINIPLGKSSPSLSDVDTINGFVAMRTNGSNTFPEGFRVSPSSTYPKATIDTGNFKFALSSDRKTAYVHIVNAMNASNYVTSGGIVLSYEGTE